MLPCLYTPPIRGARIVIVSTVDSVNPTGTLHTFSGVNFGPAYAGRIMIAAIGLLSPNETILNQSTVTIGGASAAGDDAGVAGTGGPSAGSGLWAADGVAGDSGDVVVDWTGGDAAAATLILMSMSRHQLPAHDTDSEFAGTAVSIDVPANGALIAVGANASGDNITVTGFTERHEMALGAGAIVVGWDLGLSLEVGRAVDISGGSQLSRTAITFNRS